ncbi:zinc ribbon domain-containing protein [Methanobrevibacter sp.]|uniref:zinc ribbon domain-containing protein n=1 Tax=Methanobrevibacter sp. TaxID=66852 RepID=UPI0025D6E469|nr:zinc ribbon domain-containing protein [Methanobrevibacter sp.]MBR4447068.1 zinc ribbon domain-containing protein [Methanobrevibacter sp.]
MKCSKCGFENKDKAKFCTKCGNSLTEQSAPVASPKPDNTKYIIIALIAVIVILAGTIGYFALNGNSDSVESSDNSQDSADSQEVQSVDSSNDDKDDSDSAKTTKVSSSKSKSKEWELIGSYSGSGSGSETISVPEGKIMVKLSAYPILNYATNHLYVTGSNDVSGGVDWGPKSDVETRYDSFTYTSSSEEEFTIDYYETVNWEVDFYRYQ